MTDIGQGILNVLYPPPPPAHITSPVAFGEAINDPKIWKGYRHIHVMEEAILRALSKPGGGRLIIAVSVRHGKSQYASRIVPSWFLGTNPDKRVMLVGHESDFASRHGRAARDILTAHCPSYFGVRVSPRSEAANRWDIDGREGGMLTLGVGGSPIGRGGDLIVVDDPYRNYADAMNPNVRDKVFEFVAGTLTSRLAPGGTMILVLARWHVEDIVGRITELEPGVWDVLRMPAPCDDPTTDPLGRQLGEPLWPEVWPVEQLLQRKRSVSLIDGEAVWNAQYQQEPQGVDGDFFDRSKWNFTDRIPECRRWVRAWDLAASKDAGDWTVGVLLGSWGKGKDERWVVADVVRGRWDSDEVRRKMVETARKDPPGTMIELPQDPGQAGKDQAKQMVSLLKSHGGKVRAIPQSGSKEIRAGGVSSQQLAGNISLPKDPSYIWVGPFASECDGFPSARHDDQVDALSSAYNRLVGRGARLLV